MKNYLTMLDVLALLVGALCHDCQHPGLNNTFQVNAKTKLALTYNDISVLENMHASIAFQLLEKPEYNILHALSPLQYKEFRKTMIQAVLKTGIIMSKILSENNGHRMLNYTKEKKCNGYAIAFLFLCVLQHSVFVTTVLLPP